MAPHTRRSLYKRQKQGVFEERSRDLPSDYTSKCRKTSNKFEEEEEEEESGGVDMADNTSGCCTPKGKRFRIPEILSCPPAPKKRRLTPNCSPKRTPIAFFAPPDIELFFFFAFRNISA